MAETVFPGTQRRFAPTILLVGQGGTSPAGWSSVWNNYVEPYYDDWIDQSEGVKMGLYHPALALKTFYKGSITPSNPSNPNDNAYDWSYIDAQLGCNPIAQGKAKFHFMLDVEGGTIPQWMINQGLVHYPPGHKEVIDLESTTLVNYMKGFWTAYAARYNNDNRIYTIFIDEDQSHGGVDVGVWQANKYSLYSHIPTVVTKQNIIVTFNREIIRELCNNTPIGPSVSDLKMFGSGCGRTTNFPAPGGFDCEPNAHIAMQQHNPVLQNPPRPGRPVAALSISNGYVIRGGPGGWNPSQLTNPWGELLPTNKEPPANPDTNVTPAIYAWYVSWHPRGSNKNSGLGLAGNDPPGIIPSSYFCLTTTGIRHKNETPADWNRALRLFGKVGTKAVPAIPWGFDPDGGETTATASSTSSYWVPSPSDSWFIQLNTDAGLDTSVNTNIYDVDIFDISAGQVSTLHSQGKSVVGYFSAGTHEDWRPDAGTFSAGLIGNSLPDWPGEKWLDVRNITSLRPLMQARIDLAVSKGFDAIDPDNMDGYTNNTGFPVSYGHQLAYNRMIASIGHASNVSVGLKNDVDQVSELAPQFDFAVNEECHFYGECGVYTAFTNANKAVFNIEYVEKKCAESAALGFYHVFKRLELDAWREDCIEAPEPQGEIVLDAFTSNGRVPTSLSWTHPIGHGENKLLVVGVSTEIIGAEVGVGVRGVPMTLAIQGHLGAMDSYIFYMLNDEIATATAVTITVFSNDDITGTHANSISVFGAKQSSPADTKADGFGNITNITHTVVTGAGGGMHVSIGQTRRFPREVNFITGQTRIQIQDQQGHSSAMAYEFHPTSGNQTDTVTISGSADELLFTSMAWDPSPFGWKIANIPPGSVSINGKIFIIQDSLGTDVQVLAGHISVLGRQISVIGGYWDQVTIPTGSVSLNGEPLTPVVLELIDTVSLDTIRNMKISGNVFQVSQITQDSSTSWITISDIDIDRWTKKADKQS